MKKIINKIKELPFGSAGSAAPSLHIISMQQDLKFNNLPTMPTEFTELLHHTNTINYDGVFIFGINPNSYFLDILSENLRLELPNSENILILGGDDFEYLAYNPKDDCYQIIDKDDMKVLETYSRLPEALSYILKIDDE